MPGKKNIADYLSRYSVPDNSNQKKSMNKTANYYVNTIVENSPVTEYISRDQIIEKTKQDPLLSKLSELISMNSKKREEFINSNSELNQFKTCIDDFSLSNGLILKNHKIVITDILQDEMLKAAHIGHQGIVKTKALLREYTWFKNLDKKSRAVNKWLFSLPM
jgi:hypothetical protein